MPNTFVTPDWIYRDLVANFDENVQSIRDEQVRLLRGDTIQAKLPERYTVQGAPISGKALIALGVAAVIASPRKLTRRALLGLGWKRVESR